MTEQQMTLTVGYYNGNRWPIQLVISKLNITLTLEPGMYVLDRAGRKINDPYFEIFADRKQLHRELSDKLVPLIIIPPVTSNTPASAQTNPVRSVTEWKRDPRGIRQPVLTQPQPAQLAPQALPPAVLASANESVRPMSMEEARALGLVRKIREVPEDYGVNDTTGLPPGGIPKMRYSIDPGINKPVAQLPKEMFALPKDDPSRAIRAPLVSSLAQGARVPAPEDQVTTSPFANATVAHGPANSPIVAGTPAPPALAESRESQEPEIVEDNPELEPEPMPMSEVAEAVRVSGLPEPDLPLSPDVPPPLRPMTPKNKFTCMVCAQPFQFRSQLVKHAQTRHAHMVNAILANYPETPPEPPPLRTA